MRTEIRQNRKSWLFVLLAAGMLLIFGIRANAAGYYLVPEANCRYYSSSEIAGMPLQVVCYAKNEIYARNGRLFNSTELQNWFDGQDWYYGYISPGSFNPAVLNTYEVANIDLLDQREKSLRDGGYALDGAYSYDPVYSYLGIYSGSSNGDYIIADSSSRYLNSSELTSMTAQELCYAKNEIYARHGRMFASSELTAYFNSKSWYYGTIPAASFSSASLTQLEMANVSLLESRENALTNYAGYQLDVPGYNIYAVRSFVNGAPASGTASGSTGTDNSYIIPFSSTRYIQESEIAGLNGRTLCYAKNEIYARHGRLFEFTELQNWFNGKSWYYGYISPYDFDQSVLNEYEAANASLLQEYEYRLYPNGYPLN